MKRIKVTQGKIEKGKDQSLLVTITGLIRDRDICLFYHKITQDFKIKADHKVEVSKKYNCVAIFFQVQSYLEAKMLNSNQIFDLAMKQYKLNNHQI